MKIKSAELVIIKGYQLEDFISPLIANGYIVEIQKYDESNISIRIFEEREEN